MCHAGIRSRRVFGESSSSSPGVLPSSSGCPLGTLRQDQPRAQGQDEEATGQLWCDLEQCPLGPTENHHQEERC
ncbi:unnamed protein product [Timema podura]|uniref:Uncharacterized protein n=1 Tax=Timema podura TaxID=61482 RepID=A0ABN7PFV0_TIMPD|nr:unnamed protein product [Timema podura]